jgi:hypothetical protein
MKRWVQFICAILAVVLVCLTGTVSYLLTHSATVKAAGPYVFYLDYANGNDATTATPLGWWSVAYTNGNGTTPVANETAQGGTSGSSAKLTIAPTVSGGSWGAGTAAGTLYWYGKSAPFVAETLTFSIGGATCSIAADFTYCAWKTFTNGATAARIAAGDTIRTRKSDDPASVGQAQWTYASKTVTLDAARNYTVSQCEVNWTPVGGASCGLTDRKEGSYSVRVTLPASPAINTLYAYSDIADFDASGYQELSWWFSETAAVAANNWYLVLCSDNVGAVPIDYFPFPVDASNSQYTWSVTNQVKVGGGNCTNPVGSVALYTGSVTPTGSTYMKVDAIVLGKTGDLNLTTLISKTNNATVDNGPEGWWPLQSIVGATLTIDYMANSNPGTTYNGYAGSTEKVVTYCRPTIPLDMKASSSDHSNDLTKSGSSWAAPISYVGGWDRANNQQNGETFWSGGNGNGCGVYAGSSYSYVSVTDFSFVRLYYCWYYSSGTNGPWSFNFGDVTSCQQVIQTPSSQSTTSTVRYMVETSTGFQVSGGFNNTCTITYGYSCGTMFSVGTAESTFYCTDFKLCSIAINIQSGAENIHVWCSGIWKCSTDVVTTFSWQSGLYIHNMISQSNNVFQAGNYYDYSIVYFINSTFTSAWSSSCWATQSGAYPNVWFINYGGVAGDNRMYTRYGYALQQTATRYYTYGNAWDIYCMAQNRTATSPIRLKIGQLNCRNGQTSTFTAWVQKSHATWASAELVIPGGQIDGMDSLTYTLKADDTNWQQVSINATPTADGVVDVWVYVWSLNSQHVYVDTTFLASTTAAASILTSSATLSGSLTGVTERSTPYNAAIDMTDPVVVRGFQYDTDGVPYAFDWHEDGSFAAGAYAAAISGLSPGQIYYYRSYATGYYGSGYGSDVTFLTKPDAPIDLTATATTPVLYTLTWTVGTGALDTYIRGKVGSYPTDIADGSLIYDGAGDTCTAAVAGEHWFYRAWSYTSAGVWLQYSDETAMDSCAPGGGLPAAPDEPTNFTAVYSSDNLSVFLTWVMGVGSDDTLIQASLTSYPASPTDGATVYFGPSENCTDSLDWAMIEDGGVVYYSAWGNNAGGLSANHATANTGGGTGMVNALIVIPVILLLGGLSIIGDTKRNWLLILVAGFGWFLFAGWCMTTSAVAWDIYFIIAILGAMIALVTFIWPLVTRPQELPPEEEITESEKAWGGKGKRPQRPKRWQGE